MKSIFNHENIKVLRTEITTVCNARCGGCARKGLTSYYHMSQDVWSHIISDINLLNVESIYFNGNYGDFICHPRSLEFISQIKKKSISIRISTNGGIRSNSYWEKLAEILLTFKNHSVTFAIDGVTNDMHSAHRENTDLEKILANARMFISSGGNAIWQFITFQENKDQIERASIMARDYNFKQFYVQNSYASTIKNSFGQVLRSLSTKEYLLACRYNFKNMLLYDDVSNGTVSNCPWTKLKRLQIYADGTIWPCCWLTDSVEQIQQLKKDYPIPTLKENTIKEIIESELYVKFFTELVNDQTSFCGASCPGKYTDIKFMYVPMSP
jgi:MoaA/NifB/PqqE/SkfB family radical SAM enzyme